MSAIRKALDDRSEQPRFIETRWAEGYRYIGPLEEELIGSEPALVEIERTRGVRIVVEEEMATVPVSDAAPIPANAVSLMKPGLARWAQALGVVLAAVTLTGTPPPSPRCAKPPAAAATISADSDMSTRWRANVPKPCRCWLSCSSLRRNNRLYPK